MSRKAVAGALSATALLATGFFSSGALAATCAFGSLAGSTCTVTGTDFNVQYQLGSVGLYGDARIVGSNIIFQPSGFGAQSIDGTGSANTASAVTFDIIMTNSLLALEQLNLVERGRYQLNGASSFVNHTGSVDVLDLTNFDSFFESIDETAPLTINDNQTHNWTATSSVDFLTGAFHFSDTLSATVTIDNSLQAFTQSGEVPSFASIQKTLGQDNVILGVNNTPPLSGVPIPPAVWLFGSALGLLGWVRRRTANAA